MKTTVWLSATLAGVLCAPAHGELIANGGFESGFSAWTRVDQIGSEGQFSLQTGTLSPLNLLTVPSPPEGSTAAMTDALGSGSHILYQDFVVPNLVSAITIVRFSLFLNNGATDYFAPALLDFATPELNQQARVDILGVAADPFSVAVSDILQNLYQTNAGDPLVSGYNTISIDITSLLQAHQGQTLRLRFAEVDNVFNFNMGVDNISIEAVPEPSTWMMTVGALAAMGALMRRRRRAANRDQHR